MTDSIGPRLLEGLKAADRHLGEVPRTLPALVDRTRRITEKHRDLCDHSYVDGRRPAKPLSQGKQ